MMKLNIPRSMALAPFLIAAITTVLTAAAQEPKKLSETESVTVKATIEAIDKTNRIVTLKGPKGNSVDVYADETVKRFDELKVGDVIAATYSESIALQVRKPGEPGPDKERVVVRPSGGAPGGSVSHYKTTTVTIEEIDRAAPSVTVKGPEGNTYSFRVRDVKRLANLKVGDKVDITYTVALLLKVDAVER
jgi:Cu/Ag efflux protein CusF